METCIVVGAGLVGLLTARELAAAGVSVRVLERGEVGRESSWAGGGILSPLYPWRYPEGVSLLAQWSRRRYRELAETLYGETGIEPEWTPSGLLILDGEERDAAVEWAVRFEEEIESLDGPASRRCEPSLGEAASAGALWMPRVAQIRNPRLLKAVRDALRSDGVEIRSGCEVLGLNLQAGRVKGVETSEGSMAAESVVVAGGAWSAQLLAGLGVIPEVRPVRGQMLMFRGHPGLMSRILLRKGRYVIPRQDGRVLVGSTMEEVGFDKSTTEEARDELHRAGVDMVPALADCPIEAHWSGLRPGSPTGVPYIGEHPQVAGLFINAGHFRNGVVMAPASARLAADLVLGRMPALDPKPFSLATPRQR